MFNDTWKVIPSFVTPYTLFRGKSAGLQLADEMSSSLRTRWRIILYRGNRCDVWHWNNHGAGGSVANTRLNLFERSPTTRKQSSGDADEGLVSADAGTARLSVCVAAITRRLEMSISQTPQLGMRGGCRCLRLFAASKRKREHANPCHRWDRWSRNALTKIIVIWHRPPARLTSGTLVKHQIAVARVHTYPGTGTCVCVYACVRVPRGRFDVFDDIHHWDA